MSNGHSPAYYDVVILMTDPITGASVHKTMRVAHDINDPAVETAASEERLVNATNRAMRLFWATLNQLNKNIENGDYLLPPEQRPEGIVLQCGKHGVTKFHMYRDGIDKNGKTKYRSQCPLCKAELWSKYRGRNKKESA